MARTMIDDVTAHLLIYEYLVDKGSRASSIVVRLDVILLDPHRPVVVAPAIRSMIRHS